MTNEEIRQRSNLGDIYTRDRWEVSALTAKGIWRVIGKPFGYQTMAEAEVALIEHERHDRVLSGFVDPALDPKQRTRIVRVSTTCEVVTTMLWADVQNFGKTSKSVRPRLKDAIDRLNAAKTAQEINEATLEYDRAIADRAGLSA